MEKTGQSGVREPRPVRGAGNQDAFHDCRAAWGSGDGECDPLVFLLQRKFDSFRRRRSGSEGDAADLRNCGFADQLPRRACHFQAGARLEYRP